MEPQKGTIYTDKTIFGATFIGGPLAPTYLFWKNFKTLGMDSAARNSMLVGLAATVAMICAIINTPDEVFDAIPKYAIPLFMTGIATLVYYTCQNKAVEKFIEEGGKKASGWNAVGIGLASAVVFLLVMFGIALYMPAFDGEVMVFGDAEHEVYYVGDIPDSEVRKLGRTLEYLGYFGVDEPQAVQLVDRGDTYDLYMFVLQEWWDDEEMMETLRYTENLLTESRMAKPVNIIGIEERLSGRVERAVE